MLETKRSLSRFLIRRYLRFDSSQPFITITGILAFLGVAVGVMVLLIAMAIMNGFDQEFKRKLFVMNYPLTLYPKAGNYVDDMLLDHLKQQRPDLLYSPFISSQAIIKHAGIMQGGMMFGVDFQAERKMNPILDEALKQSAQPEGFQVVTGQGIADQFFLRSGDHPVLIFTSFSPGGLSLMPTMKRFGYTGSFESGLVAYDKSYMYTPLESLQKIKRLQSGQFDGIHIYSSDPFTDKVALENILPKSVGIVGWWEQNGNFFAALELEKQALFIVLMLIILIASLNIISSLLMTVMNRRKEIALLLSLGASGAEIRRSFFYLGGVIGLSGVAVGAILGALGIWLLGSFDIISLPQGVYPTSRLPLELAATDAVMVLVGAIGIVLLSSWYPAHRASKVDALSVLRNE